MRHLTLHARGTRTVALAGGAMVLLASGAGLSAQTAAETNDSHTTAITATADDYVSQSVPAANYGTRPILRTGGTPRYESFLGFEVAGVANRVEKATLKIYAENTNAGGYGVAPWGDADWSETGMNWNYVHNEPPTALGSVVGSSGKVTAGTWTSVDVTSLVTGDGLLSLALVPEGAVPVSYASRETSKPPQLVLEAPATPMPPSSFTDAPAPSSASSSASTMTQASALTSSATALLAGTDPVIAAAGDIACDPEAASFVKGQGSGSTCRQLATADLLLGIPNLQAVLSLGDNQYYCGGYAAFRESYNLSWGKLKAITHPVVGNHEYLTSGGTGCDQSNLGGAGYYRYFGAAAGNPTQGYYAFNVGAWRLYALNSTCGAAGGCTASSPQGRWLASDLAAHKTACTLAYWHIPLWSSGGRASPMTRPLVQILYRARAELILNGHDHIYERFAPQNPAGVADPVNGIREFVVGTGGANHTGLAARAANSQVLNTNTFGALKLTLHAHGYSWQFLPAHFSGNGTFTDAGSGVCH